MADKSFRFESLGLLFIEYYFKIKKDLLKSKS